MARYAIYFAPRPASALWRFGSGVLGYDAADGADVAPPSRLATAFPDWPTLTAEPARYGFHATLKAPFVLERGATLPDLEAAVGAIAGRHRPFELGRLEVATLTGFVALVAMRESAALLSLATDAVRDTDPLRAPLDPKDRARRDPERLTGRQRGYLDRWGYPYVLEEFRFHMTLAGPLDESLRDAAYAVLAAAYRPIDGNVVIDAITIFGQQDRSSRFRILSRHPLRG